jgi:hypothetical protein
VSLTRFVVPDESGYEEPILALWREYKVPPQLWGKHRGKAVMVMEREGRAPVILDAEEV